MAAVSTEWALNLGGNIRDVLKKVTSGITEAVDSIKAVGTNWELTEKKTKKALKEEESILKNTRKELLDKERTLKELEKAWNKATPGQPWFKAKKAVEDQQKEVDKLKEKLFTAGENVRTLKEDLEGFSRANINWSGIAIQVNQVSEIISKVIRSFDFAVDVKNLRRQFEQLTDLSGKDLYEFLKRSREIADVYKEDAKTVGEAANALTRQMGGSYESNLAIIEEGLKRGANLNGDYLSILKRYAPTLQEMGVSATEATSLIAQAAKQGVEPGNFIESIQKAGVEIRKMSAKTEEALADIGVKRADLEGKTAIEAVQHITKAMDGMTEQAKQMTISKIFKMQGERSGMEFIMGLNEGIPPLDEIPAVEETASGFKRLFSNIKTWAGDAFGTAAEYSQAFAPAIQLIAGAIPIMTALKNVTWLNTVATGAWTAATKILGKTILGIPVIGWILAIITAIVAVVKYTEGWGKAWDLTFKGMKLLVEGFEEGVKASFTTMVNNVMIAIDKIKLGWYKFKQAVGLGDSDENQAMIDQINADVEKRKDTIVEAQKAAVEKTTEAVAHFIAAGKSIKIKKDKEEDSAFNLNQPLKGVNALSFEESTSDKGSAKETGLSISGRRGAANITMTINNYFNAAADVDIRSLADKVAGRINDVLQDAIVTI